MVPQRSHSPARRASGRLARLSAQPGSARSKRLSYARDELDQALQNAVGQSDTGIRCDVPGDMTTSQNEDFSIISMESLQSAKETSMSNVMQTIPEGDKSAASVSYMPSSPPKVRYPNIQHRAERARSSLGKSVINAYDPMSWKPTGPSKTSSPQSTRKQQEQRLSNERQWQRERESVSQQIDNANADDVMVVDGAQDDVEEDREEQDAAAVDEDIWQDEASRSLDEDHQGNHRSRRAAADQPKRSPQLEDLFAGEPLKPLRSKIPRTWRRSSGMDFSYVDSPAHEPAEDAEVESEEEPGEDSEEGPGEELEEGVPAIQAQDRRHSTDGSGVLTPPSTEHGEQSGEDDDEEAEYEESEFEPDAEATRVQDAAEQDEAEQDEAASPDSDESMSSPDGEDTGNFFQTNLPQVYMKERPRRRPPRQKTMDLTELLNLDGANSPAKAAVTSSRAGAAGSPKVHRPSSSSQTKHSPLRTRATDGRIKSSPNEQGRTKVVDSPLRKSLLRSSKMYGNTAVHESRGTHMRFPQETQIPEASHSRSLEMQDAEPGDSFESKASDQRQLLSEAAIEEQHHSQHAYDQYDNDDEMVDDTEPQSAYQAYAESEEFYEEEEEQDVEVEGQEEDYSDEEEAAEPSRSYEEHLNLDSPQKIRVNFNDSKSSSLLANRKHYPPLLDLPNAPRFPRVAEQPDKRMDSPGTITLVDKKPTQAPSQPGFFSRLSTSFWNAVIGSSIPPEPLPTAEECTALFSPNLRAQIRGRYGVVSEEFPWTFAQMRTLHRMLNSLTSNRLDSIVPRSGPLPLYLDNIIDTYQTCVAGREFHFTEAHAYVVLSYFQVTVSRHLIEAIRRGEVEPLGDDMAKTLREAFGDYHGEEAVFVKERQGRRISDWVDAHTGRVGMDFVIRALGTCVEYNTSLEEKWGLPFEELQRRDLIGKKPPGWDSETCRTAEE